MKTIDLCVILFDVAIGTWCVAAPNNIVALFAGIAAIFAAGVNFGYQYASGRQP